MKTINPQQRIFLSLLFLGMLFPLGAETEAESLWRKARDYQNETAHWKPGSIAIATDEYNRKGEREKTGFLHMILDRTALPELAYHLEEARENGRDITARSRKSLDEEGRGAFADTVIIDPLQMDPEDLLHWDPPRDGSGVFHFSCIHSGDRGEPLTFAGTVRLDPDNGAPRELLYSAVDPPRVLKSMDVRVSYGPDASGLMVPREVVMEMRVKILLLEKTVKVTTRYDDYVRFSGEVSHE